MARPLKKRPFFAASLSLEATKESFYLVDIEGSLLPVLEVVEHSLRYLGTDVHIAAPVALRLALIALYLALIALVIALLVQNIATVLRLIS